MPLLFLLLSSLLSAGDATADSTKTPAPAARNVMLNKSGAKGEIDAADTFTVNFSVSCKF